MIIRFLVKFFLDTSKVVASYRPGEKDQTEPYRKSPLMYTQNESKKDPKKSKANRRKNEWKLGQFRLL